MVVTKSTNRWTGRENSLDEVVNEMADVKLAKTCARQDKEWRGNVDFSGCRATPVIGICRLLHITSTPLPPLQPHILRTVPAARFKTPGHLVDTRRVQYLLRSVDLQLINDSSTQAGWMICTVKHYPLPLHLWLVLKYIKGIIR